MKAKKKYRSSCPASLALDIFGDKWTLLVVRDMILNGKQHFREFMQSDEKIASNVLATRLLMLEEQGIIRKDPDPGHKQKLVYTLTPKGVDLFPVILAMVSWSLKYQPVDPEAADRAEVFLKGGPEKVKEFMGAYLKRFYNNENKNE